MSPSSRRLVVALSLMAFAWCWWSAPADAQSAGAGGSLASVTIRSTTVSWRPSAPAGQVQLTVSGPADYYSRRLCGATCPGFSTAGRSDGTYTYELRLVGGGTAASGGSGVDVTQSGHFVVAGGRILVGGAEPIREDAVVNDDQIVAGSLCIGYDCATDGTESFGFSTIKMKENNTRLHFDDTSSTAGFPANDWWIVANDSASGGGNYLAFEDLTAARMPFKVMAGAPNNALFVDATGRIGLGTATPSSALEMTRADEGAAVKLNRTGGASLLVSAKPNDGNVGLTTWHPLRFLVGNTVHTRLETNFGLTMRNGATCTAGGVWTNASSRDLKDNIRGLETDAALSALEALAPVTFTYKAAPEEHPAGFIAEDVPALVASTDRKGLSAMDIVAVLTKVVQDQQRTIAELRDRLDRLEAGGSPR